MKYSIYNNGIDKIPIRCHIMRLLAFYLFMISTGTFATFKGQQVTLNFTNASFQQVALSIQKQTRYSFAINNRFLDKAKPVTLSVKDAELEAVLQDIFQNRRFTYTVKDRVITLVEKPKHTTTASTSPVRQQSITGRVIDSLGNPIQNTSVTVKGTSIRSLTNKEGYFSIAASQGELLELKILGYQPQEVVVSSPLPDIKLQINQHGISEVLVVNTGFQSVPKERATGSFSIVSNELFNQQVGTDIISRLPNVANSLVVDQSKRGGQLMVRGLSTISGPKDPLIIQDNFPYEGDLENINPNIVENITILKDASASSIWGARAANGVIVITTKKGVFNQTTRLEFNSNLTISEVPDLSYIRQMSASDFIDIEQELFKKGFYRSRLTSRNRLVVSPVVNYLDRVSKGLMTQEEGDLAIDALRNIDVRTQLEQYMYKPAVKQQYFLSAQGGSETFSWLSSIGYDHNKETLGEGYDRFNARFQNTYKPIRNLSVLTNLYYTQTGSSSGRLGYSNIAPLFPYTQIADEEGNAMAVPKNFNQSYLETLGNGKLLDWKYYPLTDWKHQTSKSTTSNFLSNIILKYKIIEGFGASVDYQFERQSETSTGLADENSFTARDYVNRFSQIVNGNVVYIVPNGGILDKSSNIMNVNNLRGQLSFDRTYGLHNINAIAGAEMRSTKVDGNNVRYYGYNSNNLTTGLVDFTKPYPSIINGGNQTVFNGNSLRQTDRRFLSQYANAAYTFDNKYIISGSLRRDGSNLFGLKTNDQWNPFWSAGVSWKLFNEEFYKSQLIPYLNVRATYGFSGNVDPAMVAVNTIRYLPLISPYTNNRIALFNNYYNPELQWETSKMLNIAFDFNTKNDRLSGTFEYFRKHGINLFGMSQIDYTAGVDPWIVRNVASMKGDGFDIELKSLNINQLFKWNTILNLSFYKDKIQEYNVERSMANAYISNNVPPISGVKDHAVYSIYGYKWAGLDPETGEARGYLNGEVSNDYTTIIGTGTRVEDLQYFGSAIPTKFGSMINTFSYKNLSLNIGLTYKFGYAFRRNTLNYTNLFNSWQGHSDYALRWQTPGDERTTNVPANTYTTNANRDLFYEGTEIMVEKGDHIRLQYINMTYTLRHVRYLKALQVYLNASNLGVVWRANKLGIDPDFNYPLNSFIVPKNYALGIKAQF